MYLVFWENGEGVESVGLCIYICDFRIMLKTVYRTRLFSLPRLARSQDVNQEVTNVTALQILRGTLNLFRHLRRLQFFHSVSRYSNTMLMPCEMLQKILRHSKAGLHTYMHNKLIDYSICWGFLKPNDEIVIINTIRQNYLMGSALQYERKTE